MAGGERVPALVRVWWAPSYLPGPPEAVWWCGVQRDNPHSGTAATLAAAGDAGRAHLKDCPGVAAALDRLLADVMALPEYRRMHLTRPHGQTVGVVTCVDCGGIVVDDEVQHTVEHLDEMDRAHG